MEEIFEKHVTDNGPVSRIYKELLIFDIKKAKMKQQNYKNLSRHFTKQDLYHWETSTWKDTYYHYSLMKYKSKPQWYPFDLSERLKLKSQTLPNVGEDT